MNASKKTLVYLFMGLAALASVVPFIWMLVTSLKTQAESIQIPLTLLPAHPSLQAYGRVMHEIPFAGFISTRCWRPSSPSPCRWRSPPWLPMVSRACIFAAATRCSWCACRS